MNAKSTLFWSAWRTYEHCPQEFLWCYGWEEIDLGKGPGKGKPYPEVPVRSKHRAVMGKVVQRAVEHLYNNEVYYDPHTSSGANPNLVQDMMDFVEQEWKIQVRRQRQNFIDYEDAGMSDTEMVNLCQESVRGYLRTMKRWKLLGRYARAELKLIGWLNKWVAIGGIMDMVITRDDVGVTILDGKNTRHKMKYTDPDQLRWYALVFQRAYGQMPDRIGFVWYQFPFGEPLLDKDGDPQVDDSGAPVVESGVEWIPFTEEDLEGIAARAIQAREGMRKREFQPSPNPSHCRICDFESVCEARLQQREQNASRRKSKHITEISEGEGFVDLPL